MTYLNAARHRIGAVGADVRRLVECESPSSDLAALQRSADVVADLFASRLAQSGLVPQPERLTVDGVPHLRWRFGERTRVLLLGHHDTVWPLGTLARLPHSVSHGVMRGPGCFDMAVGLAQALHAVCILAERHGADAVAGVTIMVTGDEEVGSTTSRALIEEEARGADAVFVLEASGPGGALKTERKGVALYTLTVKGRAAHAGLDPHSGINAGMALAQIIPQLSALSDRNFGTTVTPTSGTIGTTVNTVPAQATINVDVRASSTAELERVDTAIRGLRPSVAGARVEVAGGINRPPLEHESAAKLYARAQRLAPTVGIDDLSECAVGGASDGNFTAGVGAATLDGLGGVGDGAHADHEHVLTAHIAPRTALLATLIEDVLGGSR